MASFFFLKFMEMKRDQIHLKNKLAMQKHRKQPDIIQSSKELKTHGDNTEYQHREKNGTYEVKNLKSP